MSSTQFAEWLEIILASFSSRAVVTLTCLIDVYIRLFILNQFSSLYALIRHYTLINFQNIQKEINENVASPQSITKGKGRKYYGFM